jgi:hypothetical protein
MTAFHYCCGHSRRGIEASGYVLPTPQLWTDIPLSWWTTLAEPDRVGLGLTSTIISCDRTSHRFAAADDAELTPWRLWAASHGVPSEVVHLLEHEGSRPEMWLVATAPVPCSGRDPKGSRSSSSTPQVRHRGRSA